LVDLSEAECDRTTIGPEGYWWFPAASLGISA
jgi:hypothetical protein